ncbi:MAG: TolC family protein [Armatimonadota bacterium]
MRLRYLVLMLVAILMGAQASGPPGALAAEADTSAQQATGTRAATVVAATDAPPGGSVAPSADAQALASLDRPLSLADCLHLAVQLRPRLEAARADLESAQAATDRQRAARWPLVEAVWDWRTNQTLARPLRLEGGILTSRAERTTTREASVGVDFIFWDSSQHAAINQARASEEVAWYHLGDTQRQLLETVATLYYTALANEKMAEVTASAVVSARRHLDLVRGRIEAGTAAEADRLPVEVELAQAQLRAVQAEDALKQSLAELRATLGVFSDIPLRLTAQPERVTAEEELAALWERAATERDDLEALRATVRSREWAARLAKMDAGLSVQLSGHAEYGRYSGTTGESWWVGAGASAPLFSKQARADVKSAEAGLAAAKANLADAELMVRQAVEQAYLSLRDASERVAQAAKAVESAQVNLQAAEERYAEGVATIIEVTDAEQSLREAQADDVQARYQQNVAAVQLRSAVGEDLLLTLGGSR